MSEFIELCCSKIRQVLSGFLMPKQANEAANLWLQRFSQGPLVAIQPFVALVCEKYRIADSRSNLYFALMTELTQLRSQQRKLQNQDPAADPRSKEFHASQTFIAFMGILLNKVAQKDISKKYWLVEALHFPGRDKNLMVSTEMWQDFLLDGRQSLPFELSVAQMKAMLFHLQRKLRDLLSVEESDRLLLAAITETEKQACNLKFPIRNLV